MKGGIWTISSEVMPWASKFLRSTLRRGNSGGVVDMLHSSDGAYFLSNVSPLTLYLTILYPIITLRETRKCNFLDIVLWRQTRYQRKGLEACMPNLDVNGGLDQGFLQ